VGRTRLHRIEFSLTEPGETMPNVGIANPLKVNFVKDLFGKDDDGWRASCKEGYSGQGDTEMEAVVNYLRDRFVTQ